MPVKFEVGENFKSLEDLYDKVQAYFENEHFKFVKSHTKKIKDGDKSTKKELQYSYIDYTCICSGEFHSRGLGKRQRVSLKTQCPAYIKIQAQKDILILTDLNLSHNHEPLNELKQNLKIKKNNAKEDAQNTSKITAAKNQSTYCDKGINTSQVKLCKAQLVDKDVNTLPINFADKGINTSPVKVENKGCNTSPKKMIAMDNGFRGFDEEENKIGERKLKMFCVFFAKLDAQSS